MEHILFLTGRLAQPSLERVLAGIEPAPFTWETRELGLQVAALMTAEMIRRRVAAPAVGARRVDRIIVPGRCRGDLDALAQHFGIPVQRGPDEVKDLPRFFDRAAKPIALDDYAVAIFAEIVDAPHLSVAGIVARATRLRADGADVIDLGCLPETRFDHLADSVQALKAEGFKVSVDSIAADELLRGGRAGADYLLSLTLDSLWIADEVASTPILIPRTSSDEASLFEAVEIMQRRGREFYADSILDPIPFGLAASIVRYHRLRERFPQAAIMMGVGNLTELTEADTSGINALLFGICAELDVAAVLTTQVSPHACRAVKEADWARRIMHGEPPPQLAQGPQRRAADGARQAAVPRHARRDRGDRGAGARPELPRPGVATRPACLQPRRVAPGPGRVRAVAATRARRRRGPRVLHGGRTGARRDRPQARQALCAGPAARLGLCGRPRRSRPGRVVRTGHDAADPQDH